MGKRKPRLGQLQAIAEALNVTVSSLMGFPAKTHWADIVKESDETFGERLANAFAQLNDEGQQKAVERVEELAEIPRYRTETAPQPPAETSGREEDTPTPEEPAEGPPEAGEGTK